MSRQIEVTFMVDVEESISESDVTEWLEFELGDRGGMKTSNPAAGDIEAYGVQITML